MARENEALVSERTPLLDDQPKAPEVSVSAVSGESSGDSGDEGQNSEVENHHDGIPQVAAKIHLVLPAIGIGVSLSMLFLTPSVGVFSPNLPNSS